MASIGTIKECIKICRDANVTPFIWGDRGMGKSSLVSQLAAINGWGFIDLRCSQLEASDIRGLPDRGDDGRTHFLPPADMPIGDLTDEQIAKMLGELPTPPKKGATDAEYDRFLEAERQFNYKLQNYQSRFQRGILFLDELNRASDDVLQAAFQLVLDRRVGQYVLPPGWSVVVAGNFTEGYMVSGFNDPAFINRFCHLTLSGGETTLEEWVNYMSSVHGGDCSDVIEFASQNVEHLDGNCKGKNEFSIQPSRRSWEAVVRVNKAAREGGYSDTARTEVLAGLIGRELALSYSRYSCPVKPKDLLTNGVKAMQKKLAELSRNQMQGLMWGMVSFCKEKINDDKVAEVCLDLTLWMCKHAPDKDIVVAFCRALVSDGGNDKDKSKTAVISNPKLAKMIADYHKAKGITTKGFVDRLAERPELQEILSRVSWGK